MTRLVQLRHPDRGRRIAVVDEPRLKVLPTYHSIYQLAWGAIQTGNRIEQIIAAADADETFDYDPIYEAKSDWSLLPAFDHPDESARCFINGTGLTHKASAANRQSMHALTPSPGTPGEGRGEGQPTDSMRMYQIGLDGGRPAAGCIGAAPEWFYKGVGTILRAHNQPLDVPPHAEDGGDEAEIAGVYLNGSDGTVYRVGLAQGNEFSDHLLEAKNYLYLAQSKLRSCSLGPELVVDADFSDVTGRTAVERNGKPIWQGQLASGEKWICHSLANMEHHHFKHAEHRRPGDVHIHFFGADEFSFKDRLRLQDGDVMVVAFEKFGRPLRNPIRIDRSAASLIAVKPL